MVSYHSNKKVRCLPCIIAVKFIYSIYKGQWSALHDWQADRVVNRGWVADHLLFERVSSKLALVVNWFHMTLCGWFMHGTCGLGDIQVNSIWSVMVSYLLLTRKSWGFSAQFPRGTEKVEDFLNNKQLASKALQSCKIEERQLAFCHHF